MEFSIVPLTEGILPKKRILELYLNIVEWGPGIDGAEAASRYYFGASANRIMLEGLYQTWDDQIRGREECNGVPNLGGDAFGRPQTRTRVGCPGNGQRSRRKRSAPLRRGQDSEARTRPSQRDLPDYCNRDALAMVRLVENLEGLARVAP